MQLVGYRSCVPNGRVLQDWDGCIFFFSSRRRHTRCSRDWSSDVCSSDLSPSTRLAHRARAHLARRVMTELRDTNRAMFWRILRRLLGANRGRMFVMLLALGAGAAVTAALLNLQVDAKRRLTTEFRAFGPNVVIVPKGSLSSSSATLSQSIIHSVPANVPSGRVTAMSALYMVASVWVPPPGKFVSPVCGGIFPVGFITAYPSARPNQAAPPSENVCVAGVRFAKEVGVESHAELVVASGDRRESCRVASFRQTGGPEDNRLEIDLRAAQRLADLPDRVSMIELTVPGTPAEIQNYIADLQRDRKSTRLNSSHGYISYAVFCLKKKKKQVTLTEVSHYASVVPILRRTRPRHTLSA